MKFFAKIILILMLAGMPLEALAATVQNIRTSDSSTRVRIVLDLDAPVAYKDLSQGNVLTLTLAGKVNKPQTVKMSDQILQSIQLLKDGSNSGRLVVSMTKSAQHKVLVLKNPNRIVLDIYRIQIIRQHTELGQGMAYNYWQDDFNGRPLRLYFVELKPQNGYEVKPFSAALNGNGRGRLLRAANATRAKAVVNACYFDTDGWVVGNCKADGAWIGADGEHARSALVIAKNGKPDVIQGLQYQGIVTRPDGKQMRITGMNRARIAGDLVLFNRNYGASTGTNEFGREVKLVDGRVTDISVKGNMTLQANAIVLSGHGANADALATLKKGDKVNVSQTLGNDAADAADAVVGAGPSLLTDGKIDVRTYQEGIASDISYGRSPRTAVGLKADGTMLILVADGRSSSSVGLTLTELAGYLRRLGAVKAVNFDGGGSSEMVVNGRIVNNPSDGGERPVSIALGVFSK
jgi:hypothetical protein